MTAHPPKRPPDLKRMFDELRSPPPDLKRMFDELRSPPPDLKRMFDELRSPPPHVEARWMARPPAPPLNKRKRKKGAGHPFALTEDEKARGRAIFHDLLRKNPKLRKKTRAEQAQQVMKKLRLGRKVSDDTLLRHIIRPMAPRAQ